jgi:hypothetical protein
MLIEFGREPAHLVALAPTLLDQVGVQHFHDVTVRRDPLDEPIDGADVAFDPHTLSLGGHPRLGIGGQAAFGLVETPFEELMSLVEAGVVDLEVLAT